MLQETFAAGVSVRSKAPADMVTEADTQSEQCIVDLIRASFPDHAILAEETHSQLIDAEHLWIIDPLDGTTNFVHNLPHVAVSVAYYHAGQPEVGVVYNPMRDDWYEATRGAGATHNGDPAQTSSSALDESLVGVGFYYDRGAMMQATLRAVQQLFEREVHGVRRFGTAALDLCQVGTGQFGAFFEYQLSPWDFAAGRLFVQEAGGVVTDCLGDALQIRTSSVFAASTRLHADVLPIVRSHCPDR